MIGKRIFFLVGAALRIVVVLVSCQSAATPTLATLSEPGIAVGISDDSCRNVTVKVGQQISWTNQGRDEHIVRAKSVDGQNEFDSGTIQPGDSFALTLALPDIYEYECSADGSLTGRITVEP
jgi:plastocyanin